MADIDIQRKESTPIWPWIVGLVLIALLVWAAMRMFGGRDEEVRPVPADTIQHADTVVGGGAMAPEALDATGQTMAMRGFMADCHGEQQVTSDDPARVRDYAAACFEQLATALQNIARREGADSNVDQHTRAVQEQARQLREAAPGTQEQAMLTRQAAMASTNALEAVQQAWFGDSAQLRGSVEQSRQAAQQIQPAQQIAVLAGDLRTFFRRAGDALGAMTPRS
jgi:hypothetical protein